MKRWKVTCAYDGTAYYGWQSQMGGNTIQDVFEAKLKSIFKEEIRIHAAGRTDSGVHAAGQVFHFDAIWKHSAEKLRIAIGSGLPHDIQVVFLKEVTNFFHARFSAKKKRYVYHFYLGNASPKNVRYFWSMGKCLDISKMRRAASYLVGNYDFAAFGVSRGDGSKENTVKEIYKMDLMGRGPKLRLVTEGNGYLYKMVRSIVGTLAEVGRGKLDPDEVKHILESRKRTRLVPTAPPQGLVLDKIYYR